METADLSQQDFAMKLGISPASLSSIYTGRTNPTNNHVMAVHRAFPEVDINWLMFGEGEMFSSSADGKTASAAPTGTSSSLFSDADKMAAHTDVIPSFFIEDEQPSRNRQGGAAQPEAVQRKSPSSSPAYAPNPRENANIIDKKPRKIKEIRVFFDDGTYESFIPSSR